jgi:beta-galactosidase GanA
MILAKSFARFLTLALCCGLAALGAQQQIPHLQKQGTATQLIVDGRPFLIIGGELHNSSSSNLEYMKPIWQRMLDLNFNTVLAAVTWETIEPEEGKLDFRLVDGLIEDARRHDLRLVFLWFGSWKNGMSSYIPLWVKQDYKRFPRVKIKDGETIEVLSTLSAANQEADAKAYAALMRHIREVDGEDNTVIMMQVENEVGVRGDSRDRNAAAEEAFNGAVPAVLMDYLKANKDSLLPEIRERWASTSFLESGSWEEVFGQSPATDEAFMAWNYATYIDKVTAAGKAEYDLPMFVNAWLSNPEGTPGDWPSGGPLPQVMEIWKVAAPHIDMLTPDIYQPNFAEWCQRYTQLGNPLLIPETGRSGANPFYAYGQHDAIGVSPFAVDSFQKPSETDLAKTNGVIRQLAPLILEHQGKGEMIGVLLTEKNPSVTAELGGYKLEVSLDAVFTYKAKNGHGLVIATGESEFIAAGTGFRVIFSPTSGPGKVGLGPVDEGTFSNGKWIPGRRLNGDETDQGESWRISSGWGQREPTIQRCTVYKYE